MTIRNDRGHTPAVLLLLIAVLGLALGWCLACAKGYRATPGQTFGGKVDSASRSAVLAYATSLEWDSTPGASDEQRLLTDSVCYAAPCTVGPLVRIDPEFGAYRVRRAGIRAGRFIARLVNLDSIAYPKLNLLPHGTTYWWVDSTDTGLRSVFVSSDTSVALDTALLIVHDYPNNYRWRQAIAKFVWVPTDEQLWTACDTKYCCKTSP